MGLSATSREPAHDDASAAPPPPERNGSTAASGAAGARPSLEQVYTDHVDFVWRSIRRLGVPPAAVEDAVQDVFLVVSRRLAEFEGRSTLRTWLFAIVRRVARDHRPSRREVGDAELIERAVDPDAPSPSDRAAEAEGARLLHALLATLDDEKREAFVLADLEQMPVPEVAQALGLNLNTAYSRVRAARQDLDRALARLRAQRGWK
jgi:RNA polymerase sigma-70 factor (ECF subfamily)